MKKIALVLLILSGVAAGASAVDNWVTTWGTALQLTEPNNMPPKPGLAGNTLRQLLRVSIGGKRIRLQVSNVFGREPVEIRAAQVALSEGKGIVAAGSSKAIYFDGQPGVTLAPKQAIWSDPLDFPVEPLGDLAVTIYFGNVSKTLTGHPGSRTMSYIQAGNAMTDVEFSRPRATAHWYVLARIDVAAPSAGRAIVALGDSITDGRGSTTNGNDRWPDNLSRRLRADGRYRHIAVVNMGIGGNAVYSGGLGPAAVSRIERDVLDVAGVRWLIILHGVNDIGGSGKLTPDNTAAKMIAAYEKIIDRAHARKIKVYGATILPFGGSQYDKFDHEAARRLINTWIRTSKKFDAMIDMEAAVRDPENPANILKEFDTGDHLHLNRKGLKKLADVIDLGLFLK